MTIMSLALALAPALALASHPYPPRSALASPLRPGGHIMTIVLLVLALFLRRPHRAGGLTMTIMSLAPAALRVATEPFVRVA
jgi:hypothetical protein